MPGQGGFERKIFVDDGNAKALSPEEERRLPDKAAWNRMTAGVAARNALDTSRDGSI